MPSGSSLRLQDPVHLSGLTGFLPASGTFSAPSRFFSAQTVPSALRALPSSPSLPRKFKVKLDFSERYFWTLVPTPPLRSTTSALDLQWVLVPSLHTLCFAHVCNTHGSSPTSCLLHSAGGPLFNLLNATSPASTHRVSSGNIYKLNSWLSHRLKETEDSHTHKLGLEKFTSNESNQQECINHQC